jgi:hypothetical protein
MIVISKCTGHPNVFQLSNTSCIIYSKELLEKKNKLESFFAPKPTVCNTLMIEIYRTRH